MMKRRLFAELRRRNVLRAAVLYIGAVWALTQGIAQLTPVVGAPEWAARWFLVAAVVAFPFWIAFAWFFEFTPEGLKRERDVAPQESITRHTGRKLDFAIIGVLAIAVVLLLTDRLVWRRGDEPAASIPAIESDPSIAVLPLVNMSGDRSNEYFSDGISEELSNLLAKVPRLRVIARTSSFAFKGKDASIQDIARVLRVAAVLEGSVRKAGDKVRITVQLIRANDGSHLWSETYDRTLDDIFKVQEEIAGSVVEQLRIKLLGGTPTVKAVDAKAYPLILQAQALIDQSTAEGLEQAIGVLRQALTIAPKEPRAWEALARAYFNQTIFALRPVTEGIPLSKDAANMALEFDPDSAAAHASLARIAADFEFDLPASARYFRRALGAEPGNLVVINTVAIVLENMGRIEEALTLLEYRVARDPVNPLAYNNLGNAQSAAKQWDAAIESFRTAQRLSPNFAALHGNLGNALLIGKHDAVGALKELEAESDELTRMINLPLALHALGRAQQADAALAALADKYGARQPGSVAQAFAFLGQRDRAFELLALAADLHDSQVGRALSEPLYEPLRDDPRWLPFLRRIGLAPEQLAKIELKVTLPH